MLTLGSPETVIMYDSVTATPKISKVCALKTISPAPKRDQQADLDPQREL